MILFSNFIHHHIKGCRKVKITTFFICNFLHSPPLNEFLTFFPKSLNVFSLILWAHAHIHKMFTEYLITRTPQTRTHNIESVDVLSDYPVCWLPNDTHKLYGHSPLSMRLFFITLLCSKDALLNTSQVKGRSPLCMHLCSIILFCWLIALAHALQAKWC